MVCLKEMSSEKKTERKNESLDIRKVGPHPKVMMFESGVIEMVFAD